MSSDRPIRRLLVANRGEIARRIFRTAHEMGIDTVAVFADGDADAPFVREAGQAVSLDGRTPTDTYLDVAKVLAAAEQTGADAVHPGYGFLAENPAFAQAVIDAGMTWVGPSPDSIASMGDKITAKQLMVEAKVPTLPSIEVDAATDVVAAAESIGFPVLIKATAGGGGKGMRIVETADQVVDAVAGAQREAESSFGNGVVFIEKYLPGPRHVEIQVLGDQHGNLVHLFERECSIQRRHQKIIEEAPSPVLTDALRAEMGAAAVTAARAIGYHSAGTVEFLVDGAGNGEAPADDASFWFLEVNTRIQVEHPVTEEVTGIDLIREQLRVAMGEPLGYAQGDLAMTGHAIEARLYAEDPANDFLPAIGTVWSFEPASSPAVRIDTGIESGSVVGVEFDPMLAKVVAHAPTRTEAALKLALALERLTVAGLTTNRDFLVATLRNEAFLAGDTTTDFIERVKPWTAGRDDTATAQAAIAATMFQHVMNRRRAGVLSFISGSWRNSAMPAERRTFLADDAEVVVAFRARHDGTFEVTTDDADPVIVRVIDTSDAAPWSITIETNGRRTTHAITGGGSTWHVQTVNGGVDLVEQSRFPDHSAADTAGGQTAPMPGRVLAVHVAAGDAVSSGQTLVIMEAMKMEHTITSPVDGVVSEVRCAVHDQVDNGQVLVVITGDDETDAAVD